MEFWSVFFGTIEVCVSVVCMQKNCIEHTVSMQKKRLYKQTPLAGDMSKNMTVLFCFFDWRLFYILTTFIFIFTL
jgi:hypothetical protein